jgi:TPR repeat protein
VNRLNFSRIRCNTLVAGAPTTKRSSVPRLCRWTLTFLGIAGIIVSGYAQAQTPSDGAKGSTPCVAPDLLRQIARSGDTVLVSAMREASERQPGLARDSQEPGSSAETKRILKQAHDAFERSARKGESAAQVNLAVASLAGWGVSPNAGAALYWLGEAARQGYALAHFDLGVLYQNGCGVRQDYGEAARYFRLGADANDAASQLNLGYFYDQGLGVVRDRAQAASWYRKAAEAGLAEAQFNLADLYVRGEGVPLDEAMAFLWFHQAAQHGHTAAQLMLAAMYSQGRGAQKNLLAAYTWLLVAQLEGDARAEKRLTWLETQFPPAQLAAAKTRATSLAQSLTQDKRLTQSAALQ